MWSATGSTLPDAAVLIGSNGRIEAVGPASSVPSPAGAQTRHFPNCVVMPGLINAHTHLELHETTAAPPDVEFATWIGSVRQAKEQLTDDAFLEAARNGVRDTWRWGTTTVADTGTSGATVRALAELGGQGVYYHEAIAPDPAAADATYAAVKRRVVELLDIAGDRVRVGVSPHAPYTVSEALYRRVVEFADAEGLPLAAHLAESQAESAFVTQGAGPFADLWRSRSFTLPEARRSPIAFAADQGLLREALLAIHVVRADAADIDLLADRDVAVAACPRSNRRHGHGDPPLAALLQAGLRVGLGTDSLLSVASLDLLAEARTAMAVANVDADRALELVTIGAALAVGVAEQTGSITPGRQADLCVVDVSGTDEPPSPGSVLSEGARVVATILGGRIVFDAGSVAVA